MKSCISTGRDNVFIRKTDESSLECIVEKYIGVIVTQEQLNAIMCYALQKPYRGKK